MSRPRKILVKISGLRLVLEAHGWCRFQYYTSDGWGDVDDVTDEARFRSLVSGCEEMVGRFLLDRGE